MTQFKLTKVETDVIWKLSWECVIFGTRRLSQSVFCLCSLHTYLTNVGFDAHMIVIVVPSCLVLHRYIIITSKMHQSKVQHFQIIFSVKSNDCRWLSTYVTTFVHIGDNGNIPPPYPWFWSRKGNMLLSCYLLNINCVLLSWSRLRNDNYYTESSSQSRVWFDLTCDWRRLRDWEIALFVPPICFQMYRSEGEKLNVHWIKC